MQSEQATVAMPPLALELREIRRRQLKANGNDPKVGGSDEYRALGRDGDAIAQRIWRSRVKSWADVAARVVAVEFHYREWGSSSLHDRAVRELVNAVDLMCRSPKPARKRAKA